ncbi:MAG: hypothetical protein WCD70_03875 [Alphaproteobacteria bacterium]
MTILHRKLSCILLIRLITVEAGIIDRAECSETCTDMSHKEFENNNKIASNFVQNGRQQNKMAARLLVHEVSHG